MYGKLFMYSMYLCMQICVSVPVIFCSSVCLYSYMLYVCMYVCMKNEGIRVYAWAYFRGHPEGSAHLGLPLVHAVCKLSRHSEVRQLHRPVFRH